MRGRTLVVVVSILLVVGGLAIASVAMDRQSGVAVTPLWVSDTATESGGNHHVPAAAAGFDGEPMVYAPVSGRANTGNCALVALDGTDGEERWTDPVAAENCTIHSVADPTLADYDGDGVTEVIVATTEQTVTAHDPQTGAVEFEYDLTSYGYSSPVVTDFVGDDRPEIVVVDVEGTVFVLRPNGTAVWSKQLSSYTWGQPAVADVDGDGARELAVGLGGAGKLLVLEQDGSETWDRPQSFDSSITWMSTGQADDDPAMEIAIATAAGGQVSVVDGATGEREWTRDLGSFAAVHAFGDGDDDGDPELYAVAEDGKLRSLDAATGETEWTTTLTTTDVQMTPPPAMGDVDGDGDPELVAPSNDGVVSVVDPATGEILGTYQRDESIWTNPRLADIDGDGDLEALVMYAYGRVVALDFE